jgi:hypothetical protein
MKILRTLSLIFLFIAIAHASNLAFWYFFMEREIGDIPFYFEHLSTVCAFIYFSLSLLGDLIIKFRMKNERSSNN